MRIPIAKIAATGARIFFLTSPNAPTGVGFPNSDIAEILGSFGGIVVADEAYAPFARENAVGLLAGHPNLVVVRTFSKAYALAGIRVGYAIADPEVIGLLDRVRDSYNVNRISQVAALAALADQPYYAKVIERIRFTRDLYAGRWRAGRGWFTFPSEANFICTEPRDGQGRTGPAVAKAAYDFLFSRKVLVRHFPSDALTASFLRISVGTDDEMLVLDESLDAWLKETSKRVATVSRKTAETDISITLGIDGTGVSKIEDRSGVLRPHADALRQARPVRPHRQGQGRRRRRLPPHGGGRRPGPGPGLQEGARREDRDPPVRLLHPAHGRVARARRRGRGRAPAPRVQRRVRRPCSCGTSTSSS